MNEEIKMPDLSRPSVAVAETSALARVEHEITELRNDLREVAGASSTILRELEFGITDSKLDAVTGVERPKGDTRLKEMEFRLKDDCQGALKRITSNLHQMKELTKK